MDQYDRIGRIQKSRKIREKNNLKHAIKNDYNDYRHLAGEVVEVRFRLVPDKRTQQVQGLKANRMPMVAEICPEDLKKKAR